MLALLLTLLALPPSGFAEEGVYFLSDTEGQHSRLKSFFEATGIADWKNGQWELKPGKKFVFGGDAMDRGDASRQIIEELVSLKERHPDRVTLLWGNRDLRALALMEHLDPVRFNQPDAAFEKWLTNQELDVSTYKLDPDARRFWAFSSAHNIKGRQEELKRLGQPASQADAFRSLLEDSEPHGIFSRYIELGQFAHIDEESKTLFVHGAVKKKNYGKLPNGSVTTDVRLWVKKMNEFGAGEVKKAIQGKPNALTSLGRPKRDGEDSLVTARYFDDDGLAIMPEREVRESLKKQGIHRLGVGHTPAGDVPAPLVEDGFEIVNADTSFNETGKSSFIQFRKDGVFIESMHPTYGKVVADTSKNGTPLAGKQIPDGRVAVGRLTSGKYLMFAKDDEFNPTYTVLSEASLRASPAGVSPSCAAQYRTLISPPKPDYISP